MTTRKRLSNRSVAALKAMANATRDKPVLPKPYVFRRDAADYLVDNGLAHYRSYDGVSHGGYWLSPAGEAALTDGVSEDK
jgi:hypothetical protein